MAAVPHPRIWYRLEALEEALARQERRLGELVERQAAIKDGLKELKEAVGLAPTPREEASARGEPVASAGPSGRGEENPRPAPELGPEAPAANANFDPAPPLPFLGPWGREALRRAIVEGTLGNGIREAMGWLQQLQEFLDGLLKILDQVRANLEQSGVRTLSAELPVLSRDTVEVMARMIKMPEFQRLAAGLLTQMLKEQGSAGRPERNQSGPGLIP